MPPNTAVKIEFYIAVRNQTLKIFEKQKEEKQRHQEQHANATKIINFQRFSARQLQTKGLSSCSSPALQRFDGQIMTA